MGSFYIVVQHRNSLIPTQDKNEAREKAEKLARETPGETQYLMESVDSVCCNKISWASGVSSLTKGGLSQ